MTMQPRVLAALGRGYFLGADVECDQDDGDRDADIAVGGTPYEA